MCLLLFCFIVVSFSSVVVFEKDHITCVGCTHNPLPEQVTCEKVQDKRWSCKTSVRLRDAVVSDDQQHITIYTDEDGTFEITIILSLLFSMVIILCGIIVLEMWIRPEKKTLGQRKID